jgi:hypothetical protein
MTVKTVAEPTNILQTIPNGTTLEVKSILWDQFASGDFTPTVETFQPSANSYWDMALNRVYLYAKSQLQRKDADDQALKRLDKGYRLVLMNCVHQEDERYFTVTSETGKRSYTVDSTDRTCDCPFFKNNEEVCGHLFAARMFRRSKALATFALEQDLNGNHAANNHDNMEQTPMQHREANYSVNFRTTYRGIENVQFTVRGSNQAELIEQLNTVIDGLQVSVNHNAETNGHADVKRCEIHEVDMPGRISKKTGRTYYGHRVGNVTCFGG